MQIFTVVFEHEYDIDIANRKDRKNAEACACEWMSGTLDEVKGFIDEEKEYQPSFEKLKECLEQGNAEEAMELYNNLYEEAASVSEQHYIFIRETKLV